MRFADISVPDSGPARAALEVVTHYSSRALVNHSIRSYLWAASYAMVHEMPFDPELLYVASMLHDIGLVEAFDNDTAAFETAGGDVAWVFGAGAGWPVDRRVRCAEIIVRHMWDSVDPAHDREGYLLCIATGLDISGRDPHEWSSELRREVVSAYPRLGLGAEFLGCFEAQARRKPSSSAAAAVAGGLPGRLAANVLDTADPGA